MKGGLPRGWPAGAGHPPQGSVYRVPVPSWVQEPAEQQYKHQDRGARTSVKQICHGFKCEISVRYILAVKLYVTVRINGVPYRFYEDRQERTDDYGGIDIPEWSAHVKSGNSFPQAEITRGKDKRAKGDNFIWARKYTEIGGGVAEIELLHCCTVNLLGSARDVWEVESNRYQTDGTPWRYAFIDACPGVKWTPLKEWLNAQRS